MFLSRVFFKAKKNYHLDHRFPTRGVPGGTYGGTGGTVYLVGAATFCGGRLEEERGGNP